MTNTLTKVSKAFSSSAVRFINDEEAASAVEYGLLASLIAAVIIGVLNTMGSRLTSTFGIVNGALK